MGYGEEYLEVLTLRIGAPDDVLEECVLRRNQSTSSAWHFAGYTLQSSPACPILSCYSSSWCKFLVFFFFFFGAGLAPLPLPFPLPLTSDQWQLGPGLYCWLLLLPFWQVTGWWRMTDTTTRYQIPDTRWRMTVVSWESERGMDRWCASPFPYPLPDPDPHWSLAFFFCVGCGFGLSSSYGFRGWDAGLSCNLAAPSVRHSQAVSLSHSLSLTRSHTHTHTQAHWHTHTGRVESNPIWITQSYRLHMALKVRRK